jgi:di/tricarboxylate transporter
LFKDIAERTVATYLQALIGLLLAANWVDGINLSFVQSAAVAAIPAALAVVKGALAQFVGNPDTASLTV